MKSDPYAEARGILREKSNKLLVIAKRIQKETGQDFTRVLEPGEIGKSGVGFFI
jgi:hypothetical protein